jgi:hypothetical protein
MVSNPGFESSGNWSQNPSSAYPATSFYHSTWGTAAPHSGSYAYVISNHVYGSLNSDLINVSPNSTYDAYACVRGEIDAEDSSGLWLVRINLMIAPATT